MLLDIWITFGSVTAELKACNNIYKGRDKFSDL